VQIGAGIASGIGQIFRIGRAHLPVLIGCGSAAGISAIFNSPIGGLLFTLEVILQDFSLRTLTPLVISSVIANFTTRSIFAALGDEDYRAIFNMPQHEATGYTLWSVGNFLLLGIVCGIVGVSLTRLMHASERFFGRLKIHKTIKPALGGAMLGVLGVFYVMLFRVGFDRSKFVPVEYYSMPAFFGDGYGAVRWMLTPKFYTPLDVTWGWLVVILGFLCIAKLIGTCLTLGSGGAGGVIAPSLFLGAVVGGALGMVLQHAGLSHSLAPESYALVGMGAVLAAVVHAPLASVLILVDVTGDYNVILPGMLATIIGTGVARMISRDSIYTLSLRMRGVRVGSGSDLTLLRRLTLEQVELEPATFVRLGDPLEKALNQTLTSGASDLVVVDAGGVYAGMLVSEDIRAALFDREAVPLLLVSEIMRANIPLLRTSDSLATVLDQFSAHDLSRLPVMLPGDSQKVIGVASRAALMRRYQQVLAQT
jgi:CIC family chloride channel protein